MGDGAAVALRHYLGDVVVAQIRSGRRATSPPSAGGTPPLRRPICGVRRSRGWRGRRRQAGGGGEEEAGGGVGVGGEGNDYSSGVWQFEAFGYVPYGTSGVCIMQVFGSSPPQATTLMLRVYNGTLSYYRAPIVVPNIYGRWFKLNVVHDVEGRRVEVYIDGVLKYEAASRGRGEAEGTSHYFKCGVYAQNDASYYMESRWKKIRVLKKCQ
ncbi:hypothetical protein Sango_1910400 [Sesamum angolense]|uniref:Alginate lyase 2 domain-containing protein n=1 Tax=Sesamum angolense TaxID=2727404 RepID=A0AAE1WJJ2_9LAMI|nr:hypothetical protein Sango_1910400 [Sesamum angolense]